MLLLDAEITGEIGNVAISSLLMGANILIMLVVVLQSKVAHIDNRKVSATVEVVHARFDSSDYAFNSGMSLHAPTPLLPALLRP